MITTKKALKPDTFKDYIKYILENFPEAKPKKWLILLSENLVVNITKLIKGSPANPMIQQCAFGLAQGKDITIDQFHDKFLIRKQQIERIFPDNTSINRFVVSEAILKCLQLIFDCYGKNSVLYSVNTDGFFTTTPVKNFKNKRDIKFKPKYIRRPFMTDSKLCYFVKGI